MRSAQLNLLFALFIFCPEGFAKCLQGRAQISPQTQTLALKTCMEATSLLIANTTLNTIDVSESLFKNSLFKNISLINSHLKKVEFVGSDLEKVLSLSSDYSQSHWTGLTIKNSKMNESRFDEAHFQGVRWLKSSAQNSSFRNSLWQHCYLENVNLQKADLRGARFEKCLFIKVDLKGALINKDTQLPIPDSSKTHQEMIFSP